MVKRDPDDLITATSKNLKTQSTKIMRITLKRAGPHFQSLAKAHSRIARRDLRATIRQRTIDNPTQVCPLYVRYKEGVEGKETKENRGERVRLNCEIKLNRGNDFISSLLGVFRVNFFKKKEEEGKKVAVGPTKPNPNSKSSFKKENRNKRNKERRIKRKQLSKANDSRKVKKQVQQMQTQTPSATV